MSTNSKHTQLPWGIEWTENITWIGRMRTNGDGKISEIVVSTDREGLTDEALARNDADAKFIVLAANCHDELVDALKLAEAVMVESLTPDNRHQAQAIALARAVLAKAKGQ